MTGLKKMVEDNIPKLLIFEGICHLVSNFKELFNREINWSYPFCHTILPVDPIKIAFGGIASQMPKYNALIIIAFFAGLGLPALSGFISEALCFIGGFSAFRTITIIGTLGILLNAVYFLRAYQRVFTGALNEKYNNLKDISSRELMTVIPIAFFVFLFVDIL